MAELHEVLPDPEPYGVEQFLMDRQIPDTLTLRGLNATRDRRISILVANGLLAIFDLPHAKEVAVLSTPNRELLEEWLMSELGEWVL